MPKSPVVGSAELDNLWPSVTDLEDQNVSLADVAYRLIRDAISKLELKPGSRLIDREVSQLFSIGRTPVREALRRLEVEGFVERVSGRELIVPKLGHKSALDLVVIREELEGLAARYCAHAAHEIEIKAMQELLGRELGMLANPIGMRDLNRQLHNLIYFSGRNKMVAWTLISLRNSMMFLPTTLVVKGRPQEVHNEHRAIIEAIADRAPERAEEAMRIHIRKANETRIRMDP